ncbi:helix-turn-helix domain-containing protein [Nocardia tengchongensis]
MKRVVGYTWRLRELMATRGKFTATELVPLLHERDVRLSASQVHRLVSGTPERLSLQVLSALCDILGCTRPIWSLPPPRTLGSAAPPPTTCPARFRRTSRNCGRGRPGFCQTHEPGLLHRRTVRALVQEALRPMRPPRVLRRDLA